VRDGGLKPAYAKFHSGAADDDGTEFVVTLFLQPDAPDGVIAEQAQNLEGELKVLKSLR
jgi:hypothetical protein